jgi:hypothetical protein
MMGGCSPFGAEKQRTRMTVHPGSLVPLIGTKTRSQFQWACSWRGRDLAIDVRPADVGLRDVGGADAVARLLSLSLPFQPT